MKELKATQKNLSNPFAIPDKILEKRLLTYLDSDIGFGDLSTGVIPENKFGNAKIIAKSDGLIAGIHESQLIFKSLGLKVELKKKDGMKIETGEPLMIISGKLRNILMAERTALNFLMKLSSIATSTADFLSRIRKYKIKTNMAATRKTTPGFGWFEKKAVHIGGGDTHRWNLSDMILLKDTHRKYFKNNIRKMLHSVKEQTSFSKKIEIEIENMDNLQDAIDGEADIIMLDNFKPKEIKKALSNTEVPPHIKIEASGNITIENFVKYAEAGVDIISTSQTILKPHKHVDYSLKLI